MELGGGGGGFWELSSAINQSPSPVTFPQHEPVVMQSGIAVHPHYHHHGQVSSAGRGGDGGGGLRGFAMVDPHLTCLKLGKRHYFEDSDERRFPAPPPAMLLGGKSGKGIVAVGGSSTSVRVARCQVEGCNLPLVNAKEYHRRHKVCEMHSKAPKVVVLGMEQRFCQQCSRFYDLLHLSSFEYVNVKRV